MTNEITKEKSKTKNKSKYIANISLGVMGAGVLATLPLEPSTATKIMQGGFEAGLVGGLADWFAVTALFRHPLNIPIPHTALLPKNREKITQVILNIVETEWLNKESILKKLENVHFTHALLNKLEESLEHKKAKDYIEELLVSSIQLVDKKEIEAMTLPLLGSLAKEFPTQKTISSLIDKSIERKYDGKMYDVMLDLIEKKISDPQAKQKITSFILKTMEKKAESSFFKIALKPLVSVGKEKLSTTIDKAIDDIILDLKDEKSENRQSILSYIQNELMGLKDNKEVLSTLENKKQAFIESDSLKNANTQIIEALYIKMESLTKDRTFIENKILPIIKKTVRKLKENEPLIQRIESLIKGAIAQFIEQNHSKIGNLVRDNLDKMKNDELIDMMENKIGKELAWIRVNGAICGFFIGIAIATLKVCM